MSALSNNKKFYLPAIVCTILALVIVLSPIQPAYADAPPAIPQQFYGTVKINGTLAGAGYTVTAKVGTTQLAATTTDAQGRYGYSPVFMVSTSQGATIDFYVNGVKAQQNFVFNSGANTKLDLTVSGTVPPPGGGATTITTASLSSGTVGSAYSATLEASGGTTPYTWSIISGSLPTNLTLTASTGVISGTPSAQGTSNFTVKVTDNSLATNEKALSITINAAGALAITTASLSSGTVGSAYSATLTASGGTTPYTWSISSGSLPAGLALNASTGLISGTPTTQGTSSLTVQVSDSAAHTSSNSLSIQVNSAPTTPPPATPVTISTSVLGTAGSLGISTGGVLSNATTLSSVDGKVQLNLNANTTINIQGQSITVTAESAPLVPPANVKLVSAYNFGPNNTTFNPAINVSLKYDPATLPSGVIESNLYLAYWNGSAWTELTSIVNTQNKLVSAQVAHFTIFAILGRTAQATPPSPASFAVSGLNVSPTSVKAGEQVTITADISNSGGSEGSYAVVLKINGVSAAEKQVTLGPGKTQTVTFTVSRQDSGSYSVSIGGQTATFTVSGATPPAATPKGGLPLPLIAVGAALVLLIIIIVLLLRRRAAY